MMGSIEYFINDRRQKILFHKDIFMHYFKHGFGKNVVDYSTEKQKFIPKIVHLCWFGNGKYPQIIEKCIASWEKYLPDYKIMLWNEEKFPPVLGKYPFAEQALHDHKYAFVADVARLYALYNYGGIYLDTDIEVLKSLDFFLKHDFFAGFESKRHLSSGVIGAKKFHPFIGYLLKWYDGTYRNIHDYYEIAITKITTKLATLVTDIRLNNATQIFGKNNIYYESNYFYPEFIDGMWEISNNTYTIHHGTGLWEGCK